MIVCVCRAVSDKHIQAAVDNGAVSFRQIVQELGVGTCCGACVPDAQEAVAHSVGRRRCVSTARTQLSVDSA